MHWIHEDIAVSGLSDLCFDEPISAVLNVCEWRPYDPPKRLSYLHQGFPDVQPFPTETVWECVLWLDRQITAGRKTLVHCAEGNSRSVTVVIAYLMFKGQTLDEIKREVLRRKPFAQLSGLPTAQPQYFQDEFLAHWRALLDLRLRKTENAISQQTEG